jgi:hypothetical protein
MDCMTLMTKRPRHRVKKVFWFFFSKKNLLPYLRSRVAENVISGKFSFIRFSSQALRTR